MNDYYALCCCILIGKKTLKRKQRGILLMLSCLLDEWLGELDE